MNDAVQRAFVAATTLQKGKGILTFLGKEQIADVA
jgi:hypothetical protein